MTRSGSEQPPERRGHDWADDETHHLAGELDAALRLLHSLLDRHAEAVHEVEAMVARLLGASSAAIPEQRTAAAGRRPELLTRQEFRVLEQICQARTNRQIARRLSITEKTAKNYVQAIFRKLRVHSRTEAVLLAVQHQWFASPEQRKPASADPRPAKRGEHEERRRTANT
jgi:DNA-binding NarL/FixJ family response regulator